MTESVEQYWVSTYPFFDSFFVFQNTQFDSTGDSSSSRNANCRLEIFDHDGSPVNDIQLDFHEIKTNRIDVRPLLESCKMDSGLKHARIQVSASPEIETNLWFENSRQIFPAGSPVKVEPGAPTFYPVAVEQNRSSYVVIMNEGVESARATLRFYSGKSAPEKSLSLPAGSTTLCCVETLFDSVISDQESFQGYLKVCVEGESLLCRFFQGTVQDDGQELYEMVV